MLKINDLEVNDRTKVNLMVRTATARKTKAGKDFLALDFFDGINSIKGNYWDWNGEKIPKKNAIVTVNGQVTEWAGNMQLNIKSMVSCTTFTMADFMPSSGYELYKVYSDAYELISSLKDGFYRDLTLGLLEERSAAWLTVPGAQHIHHAYVGGTLVHSYSVAKMSKALAECIDAANVDLSITGGMLHDIGKLETYEIDGISIELTDKGLLYDHTIIGVDIIREWAYTNLHMTDENKLKLDLLIHLILSHHGKLEYGAVTQPYCVEAYIVNSADGLDANTEQIISSSSKLNAGAMWTPKLYVLGNKPHLTTQYVSGICSGERSLEKEK